MNIFVTGCSGHLAKSLLPLLCADSRISRVTGVDRKLCVFKHEKFVFHRTDIRDADCAVFMRDHDVLIHLAFVVLRGKMDVNTMHAINIEASVRLFEAAKQLDIRRLIHVSSASVYGNGDSLDENAPLKPIPGFIYAEQKAELEKILEREHPKAIRLRPHIILGPNALPLLKNILRIPFYIRLPNPQPLLQCIHETDVARAILQCVFSEARGPINLAASDALSFRDMVKIRRPYAWGISFSLAQRALTLIWKLTGVGGEPAWLAGANESLTLNCRKAATELNWQPTYSIPETIKNS